MIDKKSCILETKNLSTDAYSRIAIFGLGLLQKINLYNIFGVLCGETSHPLKNLRPHFNSLVVCRLQFFSRSLCPWMSRNMFKLRLDI